MQGGSQSGILLALGGADRANGSGGDDIIDGGTGKDTLIGSTGDDILIGGSGNDRLFGNTGDDILDGGSGADVLTGGAGFDTFVFARSKGTDVITDFQNGQDSIGLIGLSFADLKFVQQGSKTLIQSGNQTIAELAGVRVGQLEASDFQLIATLPMLGMNVPIAV
ncbi:M10 family metallopeptidase C-terminal domain-containing protein [Phormidium tenue FACHB-886]|nr:M10 family metallopeptidase C-terminal domain-containing protein [Phormidium tenue FACHB-886]